MSENPFKEQKTIKIGVIGACGKMGRRIIDLASNDSDLEVNFALEQKGTPAIGRDVGRVKVSSNPDGMMLCDVVIDFTVPESSLVTVEAAARHKKPLVLGTTGFTDEQVAKIEQASQVIPIVFSPNMAIGVNVLFRVLADIARQLGPEYSVELVEAHHKQKKDAPSGTAKKMAQCITGATGRPVPMHAVRLGDIVGDHTVIFCGNSERIEVKHQAHTRDLFAVGAIKAARWVVHKAAGLYSMQDVLGK
jgi:4-hydroxy-tetrahydrodipicolinate reductase